MSTFIDNWMQIRVKIMHDNGCGDNELKVVFGIKKSTLDTKIMPREKEFQQIFISVFSRIN